MENKEAFRGTPLMPSRNSQISFLQVMCYPGIFLYYYQEFLVILSWNILSVCSVKNICVKSFVSPGIFISRTFIGFFQPFFQGIFRPKGFKIIFRTFRGILTVSGIFCILGSVGILYCFLEISQYFLWNFLAIHRSRIIKKLFWQFLWII